MNSRFAATRSWRFRSIRRGGSATTKLDTKNNPHSYRDYLTTELPISCGAVMPSFFFFTTYFSFE